MDRDYSNLFVLRGLVLYLIPFFILGWLIGYLWETLTLGLTGLVVWHYYYQQRLTKWLWQSRNLLPPTAPGSWSYIYDGIGIGINCSSKLNTILLKIINTIIFKKEK